MQISNRIPFKVPKKIISIKKNPKPCLKNVPTKKFKENNDCDILETLCECNE